MLSKRAQEYLQHTLIAFLVGSVGLLFVTHNPVQLVREDGWGYLLLTCLRLGVATVIFWIGNLYLVDVLNRWIPWVHAPVKRFWISLLVTAAYTCVAYVFVFWMWVFHRIGWNLPLLLSILRLRMVLPSLAITLVISIFLHGRAFLLHWKAALVEAERLKKEQATARYEALKSQVNPHFLFNSLNVLSALVHRDAQQAEQFIRQLAVVYRYILESRDREVAPLREEVDILHAYLFLMDIRFGAALQATVNLPELPHAGIAPLTLQMLAENALKHNEMSKEHPLRLDVFAENDYIVVRNNLQPKTILPDSTGTGLGNIRARYALLADKEVLVTDHDGFFTVKVPILHV